MSKEAIQAVVRELEFLPDADQRLVLRFLLDLRQSRQVTKPSAADSRSALQTKNGLLIFTGELEQPETDWVRMVREEREHDLMNSAR